MIPGRKITIDICKEYPVRFLRLKYYFRRLRRKQAQIITWSLMGEDAKIKCRENIEW